MAGIPIGPGYGQIEGRISRIERAFNGMAKTRIKATDDGGRPTVFEVYSSTGLPNGNAANPAPAPAPFTITTTTINDVPKYQVSKGSVTLGTNGESIDLGDIFDNENTATAGFVMLSAEVNEDLALSGWKLEIVKDKASTQEVVVKDKASTQEVVVNDSSPPFQSKIRLLIGKITIEEKTAKAWQAQFTSVRVVHAILNGIEVRVFAPAPTHIDIL